ncbi:hypothetical protein M427DRAFT_66526 [Gonapodya prolifera JEL478]|uniref:NADPH--hemoprotein reductase n=1 Tax=Gonapodya prolifera (strain JEL478) TaxID=1344416 RepID=A0A139AUZ4_GONPJ|nr:hypothetical protein M427DRAFT_66526 [Gonapodya prolifera JEL478]|eukprot:KXS20551.1 hypothetical protein M427DRAFT_66526 [Gonapodya prolifera JEL478]
MSDIPDAASASGAWLDTSDLLILILVLLATAVFFFNRQKQNPQFKPPTSQSAAPKANGSATAASSAAKAPAKKKKASILTKFEELDSPNAFLAFYGSQTGTAEDLANRVSKEISNLGVAAATCDIEEYDMADLAHLPNAAEGKNFLVGFFLATYGEGEPTDNAVEFYDWLIGKGQGPELDGEDGQIEVEEDPERSLENVNFFVFALGNKTYEFFNAVGRRVERKMELWGGAKRITKRGEGDDDGSLEEDFLKWKPQAMNDIISFFKLDTSVSSAPSLDKPHVPAFVAEPTENPAAELFRGEITSKGPRKWIFEKDTGKLQFVEHGGNVGLVYDSKHPYYAGVATSRGLFEDCLDDFRFPSSVQLDFTELNFAKRYMRNYDAPGTTPSGADANSTRTVTIERSCLHVELDVPKECGVTYETGDHVGLFAENDPEEVARAIKALKIPEGDLDKGYDIKPAKPGAKAPFPVPATPRAVLTFYVDLREPCKQWQLEILAKYAKDDKEKSHLWNLVVDHEAYIDWIERGQKTPVDVLLDYTSIDLPPVVALTEIFTRAQVRYYSISSSSKREPGKVGMTVVVVRYAIQGKYVTRDAAGEPTTVEKVRIRTGLSTGWVQRVHEGIAEVKRDPTRLAELEKEHDWMGVPKFHLPMFIRKSTFKLPKDPRVPVIMVGPGTGVAPFRGFVRDRVFDAEKGLEVGPTYLFYGCRRPDQDYLYHDEWEQVNKQVAEWKEREEREGGPQSGQPRSFDLRIITAFSRAQAQKVYVQHRILEHGEAVWDLLENKKGNLYICGEAKNMAKDVQAVMQQLALQFGGKADEEAAKSWFKDLKAKGRYAEDVW